MRQIVHPIWQHKLIVCACRKTQELQRLQKLENKTNRKTELVEQRAERRVQQLQRKLAEEKAVKNEAFKKVQLLRDEMQVPTVVSAVMLRWCLQWCLRWCLQWCLQ